MRSIDSPCRDAMTPGDDDQARAVVRTPLWARPAWLLGVGSVALTVLVGAAACAALVSAALWYSHDRPPAVAEMEAPQPPVAAEAAAPQRAASTEAEERQQLADLRAEIAKAQSELQAAGEEARKGDAEYSEFRRRNPNVSLTPADRQARQPLYEAMIQRDRALAACKEVRERNEPRIEAILERHPDWR